MKLTNNNTKLLSLGAAMWRHLSEHPSQVRSQAPQAKALKRASASGSVACALCIIASRKPLTTGCQAVCPGRSVLNCYRRPSWESKNPTKNDPFVSWARSHRDHHARSLSAATIAQLHLDILRTLKMEALKR